MDQTTRKHNEWFKTISLGNRKSCPTCGTKLDPGESIWTWGEYVRAKFRKITHFCKHCYQREVVTRLDTHAEHCGCEFEFQSQSGPLPEWLTYEKELNKCQK